MITLIEALNYRCLRDVRQPLSNFHVLVGPNASGKTTFLDVVGFIRDIVELGPEQAAFKQAPLFDDLLWKRSGDSLTLAIECALPRQVVEKLETDDYDTYRYELILANDPKNGIVLTEEKGVLRGSLPLANTPNSRIIDLNPIPERLLFRKNADFNDVLYGENLNGWEHLYRFGQKKSLLANLPEDQSIFPASIWFKNVLLHQARTISLDNKLLRSPSPPGYGFAFRPNGSNLPWVVGAFRDKQPGRFAMWLDHVRTALPDLKDVTSIERPEDRHHYLKLHYMNGVVAPSWTASDGTLRLLALTLPAYLDELDAIYLIEEPENGIHPKAIEAVIQSLSSTYDAQILLATHSPVILGLVESRDVLCFSKDEEGATSIVNGSNHPGLKDWRGEIDLGTLYASGVLG